MNLRRTRRRKDAERTNCKSFLCASVPLRFFFFNLIFILNLNFLIAQTDTLKQKDLQNTDLEQTIEDIISNKEIDEQVDFSFLTDALEAYLEKPLDLNQASREDLLILPGMDELKINRLFAYIATFGELTSIYELQAVPGFRVNEIRSWLPFIQVKSGRLKDINPGQKHPSGPKFKELVNGIKSEIIHRQVFIVEEQKGYSNPDTLFRPALDPEGNLIGEDTLLSLRYLGNKFRNYTRFRARYDKHFSAALVGEKDPGEAMVWNPQNQQFGYDFLSGHVAISNYGNLKNLVIGDYNLQVGQGMLLSRGLGFGKGVEVISNLKMANKGILPYTSVNENQLLRGAAGTVALGDFYFTGFYSRLALDGSITLRDTITAENIQATSIRTSGLHRTLLEQLFRRNLNETSYGGRIEYKSRTLTIGTTGYIQQFDVGIDRPINDYNQFDFRGDRNDLVGLDFDWVFQNMNFFGEFGRSRSGGTGVILGMMSSLSPTVDVSILARRFSRNFHTSKGYVFAERPTAVQNESGIYLGLKITPNPKWTLSTYFDQFYFPWNRFRASFPSRGWEFLSQLEYKPKRGTQVYLRFRSDNKEINASVFEPGQQLEYLIPTNKTQLRLHFQTKVHRDIQYKTRLEFAWYKQGEEENHKGLLFYQDLVWKFGFKYKLTGRYAIFDAPDYTARIYAYENDILGFFSIPPYYRTGSRFYLIFNWKPTRKLEFWVRAAQTHLFKEDSFGSGLEQVVGPKRTEIKLQARWKF